LVGATLAGSAAVAVAGIIGLYGLIIPHSIRMMFGVDNQKAVFLNFFMGGSFLVLIDDLSRTLTSFEIPIGVFTMLIGAPFFIFLLKKSNIGWES
jgi:iron complex transport system permease protein